jgi:hypothetical protein
MKLKILNINKFPFKLSNNLLLNIKKLIKFYRYEYIINNNNISFKFKITVDKNVFSNNIEAYYIKVYKNEDKNEVENEDKNEVKNKDKNEVKNEVKNKDKNEVKNEVKNKDKNKDEYIGKINIRIFKNICRLDINFEKLKIKEIKLIIFFLKKIYIKKIYYIGYLNIDDDIVNKINRYYSLGFRYENEYALKGKFIKILNKINKMTYNDFIKPYKKLYNIVNSINDISIIKTDKIITDYYEKKKLLNELFINMTILLSLDNILLFKEKGALRFIIDYLHNDDFSYLDSSYIKNNVTYIKHKNTEIKFNKHINILFDIIKRTGYNANNLCLILHK